MAFGEGTKSKRIGGEGASHPIKSTLILYSKLGQRFVAAPAFRLSTLPKAIYRNI